MSVLKMMWPHEASNRMFMVVMMDGRGGGPDSCHCDRALSLPNISVNMVNVLTVQGHTSCYERCHKV